MAPAHVPAEAAARPGQVLITQRLYAEVEDRVAVRSVGEVRLKGVQRPVAAFDVLGIREEAVRDAHALPAEIPLPDWCADVSADAVASARTVTGVSS